MRLLLLLLSIPIMTNSGCNAGKQAVNKEQIVTNQELSGAFFQRWIAGIKGGGSGVNLFIPQTVELKKIEFDFVYFRGMKTKAILGTHDDELYILGRFKTSQNQKEDIQLDGSAEKEYGNESPLMKQKVSVPIELNNNEALLSYHDSGEVYYIKITNIEEKTLIAMPSKPNSGDRDNN